MNNDLMSLDIVSVMSSLIKGDEGVTMVLSFDVLEVNFKPLLFDKIRHVSQFLCLS